MNWFEDSEALLEQFRAIVEDTSLDNNAKIDAVKAAFTNLPPIDLGGMPIRVQEIEIHLPGGFKMGTLEELLPGFLVSVLGNNGG